MTGDNVSFAGFHCPGIDCRYQCAHFHITAFYHSVLTGNSIKCAPIDVKAVKLRPRSMTANFKLGHLKQNVLFSDMKYFPAVSSSTVQYSIADNSVRHTTLKNVYYAKFHMILSLFQCENTTAKLVMLTSQTHCSAISFARFLRARKGMYLLVISSCDIKILTSGLINRVIPNFKIINIFSRDWWMFSSGFF